MKSILLIGLGRFGYNVAVNLSEMDAEVLAIDIDEKKVENVLPYVTRAQIGDCTNPNYIDTLGVENFDSCIVGIGDDFQSSLEITSLLKEYGAKRVISRAVTEIHAKFLTKNGADAVVYPEKQLAEWTAMRCASDHIIDFFALDKEYSVFEIPVYDEWCEKKIVDLDIRRKHHLNIIAIKKDGKLNMNFGADTVLHKDETIMVVGKNADIKKSYI